MSRQPTQRGQALVEFALISLILFLLAFVLIDLMRMLQANNAVAEATRQGARQAIANADAADTPFGAYAGSCSGTVFTSQATGSGCLTDGAVEKTVAGIMAPVSSAVTLYSNRLAANCPVPGAGQTSVCLAPGESSPASGYASCAAARTALGHDPVPGDLGGRSPEWANPKFKSCFLVQVTVVYSYSGLTPAMNLAINPFKTITSTTVMLAEY